MVIRDQLQCFSALQRAEIAEIGNAILRSLASKNWVSVLFNEPKLLKFGRVWVRQSSIYLSFSALQRAEIAEIARSSAMSAGSRSVSVLFNEPKLLKFRRVAQHLAALRGFSALQRAEIAEI